MVGAPNPALRRRVELAIRLAAPALDVALAAADLVSRVLTRGEPEVVLARMAGPGASAPRGVPRR